jgi:uncharacterized protein YuzE
MKLTHDPEADAAYLATAIRPEQGTGPEGSV